MTFEQWVYGGELAYSHSKSPREWLVESQEENDPKWRGLDIQYAFEDAVARLVKSAQLEEDIASRSSCYHPAERWRLRHVQSGEIIAGEILVC